MSNRDGQMSTKNKSNVSNGAIEMKSKPKIDATKTVINGVVCTPVATKEVEASRRKSDATIKSKDIALVDDEKLERGSWGSNIEFLLACIGNMVGVGNVWRFPYLVWKNGGGAFLLPYVISMLGMAIPILLLDTIVGQYSQRGPVHAFKNMFPIFQGLGYAAILTSAVLSTSYNMIIGWTVFYMGSTVDAQWTKCNQTYNTPRCITIEEASQNPNLREQNRSISTEEFFNYYVLGKSDSILDWSLPQPGLTTTLIFVTIVVVLSLSRGVKSSGKVVYITATFPYLMLFALFFRGITLEGASQGITYYLKPDLSKLLTITVWFDALLGCFFSLGVGMGCMIVYGSYNRFHNKLVRDVVIIIMGDMLTSLFAGLVVFSMVGYVANLLKTTVDRVVENGRSLAFSVILAALSTLPAYRFWCLCFMLGLFTLGIDSQFAFVETVTTYFYDSEIEKGRKPNHPKISSLYGVILFVFSLPFATKAGIYLFDLYENYSSAITVMVVAILECILVGAVYGTDNLYDNLRFMTGVNLSPISRKIYHILYCFILPGLLFILLVSSIKSMIEETMAGHMSGVETPWWAFLWGWSLTLVPIGCIPGGFILYLRRSEEKTLYNKIAAGLKTREEYHKNAKIHGSFADRKAKGGEDKSLKNVANC